MLALLWRHSRQDQWLPLILTDQLELRPVTAWHMSSGGVYGGYPETETERFCFFFSLLTSSKQFYVFHVCSWNTELLLVLYFICQQMNQLESICNL